MVPKQVYLTQKQRDALAALARTTGKSRSQIIREALDRLIDSSSRDQRLAVLDRAGGIWKDRTDLPDFEKQRAD